MGLFDILTSQPSDTADTQSPSQKDDPAPSTLSGPVTAESSSPRSPKDVPLPTTPPTDTARMSEETVPHHPHQSRRFSFKTFSYVYVDPDVHKPHELSAIKDHEKKQRAAQALTKRLVKPLSATSSRKAKESALIVRSLIIGPTADLSSPQVTKAVAKPQLRKLKSELMRPKSANKVIAQLRSLPVRDEAADKRSKKPIAAQDSPRGPIHAVCLDHTDEEADAMHLCKLANEFQDDQAASAQLGISNIANSSIEKLANMFRDIRLVELVKAPNLGLGEPGDGEGILAGAVPTAETVIKGIEQITPQLMALGFATGRAILPDHKGVYPPTDRMSVLTYWWGLEIALPPPSLRYLASAHSVTGTLMNFLSAVALINNGVREILPFIRYISQFVDFEFNAIKAQDRGNGVVCAATWIMPAALVPRPWDFPSKDITPSDSGSIATDRKDLSPITIPVGIAPLPTLVITPPTDMPPSEADSP